MDLHQLNCCINFHLIHTIDTSNSSDTIYPKSFNSWMVVTFRYLMTINFIRCWFSNLSAPEKVGTSPQNWSPNNFIIIICPWFQTFEAYEIKFDHLCFWFLQGFIIVINSNLSIEVSKLRQIYIICDIQFISRFAGNKDFKLSITI